MTKKQKFTDIKRQSVHSIERTHLAAALEDAGQDPVRLLADEETGSLRVNLWVWDTLLLRPVRMPYFNFKGLQASIDKLTKAIEKLEKKL